MKERLPGWIAVARGFVKERADAEDVVFRVVEKIWQGLTREGLPVDNLDAYGRRVVHNQAMDLVRSRSREGQVLVADPEPPPGGDPLDEILAREGRSMLDRTLASLDPEGTATRRIALRHDAGVALYELAPRCGWNLSVALAGGTVRVAGTRFRVEVKGASATVSVADGRVEVEQTGGGAVRRVEPSHQLVVPAAAAQQSHQIERRKGREDVRDEPGEELQ